MNTLKYDTGNTSNWALFWNTKQIAPQPPGNKKELYRYYPIHPFECPLVFNDTDNLIQIYCESDSAETYWHLAGRVVQKIATGALTGGYQETVVSVKKLWLKRKTLFDFKTNYQPNYGLYFEIPFWIRDISVSVFRYTGPVEDALSNKLNSIHSDLITLQHEFDAHTGI